MRIPIDEIPESPKEVRFNEGIGDLNETNGKGKAPDFRFPENVNVELVCYRSGRDLFFHGRVRGQIGGYCSRCLRDVALPLDHRVEFVLCPQPTKGEGATEELRPEQLGLSYYSGDEIDLGPLIREQVLLALPTSALCSEQCRGLCGGCGADLNVEECKCAATAAGDPRMAIFRTLRVDRGRE